MHGSWPTAYPELSWLRVEPVPVRTNILYLTVLHELTSGRSMSLTARPAGYPDAGARPAAPAGRDQPPRHRRRIFETALEAMRSMRLASSLKLQHQIREPLDNGRKIR